MVLEDEQRDLCQKACFAASALGYNAIEEEKDQLTEFMVRFYFQSAIGNRVDGDWCKSRKDALFSVCQKFNEQVKPHGQ